MSETARLANVGPIRGIFSMLMVVVILSAVISLGVTATGHAFGYQAFLLRFQWFHIPAKLVGIVNAGGFPAVFLLTLLSAITNALVALGFSFVAFITTLTIATFARGHSRIRAAAPALWPISSKSGPHVYIGFVYRVFMAGWRGVDDDASFKSLPKEARDHLPQILFRDLSVVRLQLEQVSPPVTDLAPRYHLRLKRSNHIEIKRPSTTAPQRLEHALLRILHAHGDWSCDPEGHHGDQKLLTHSLKVADSLVKALAAKGAAPDPLAYAIGLAHDIGKILAYRTEKPESGDAYWVKRAPTHNALSALIVRAQPEFHALSPADRNTIVQVLTCLHPSAVVPSNMGSTRELTLIAALRKIDGLETAADRKLVAASVDDSDVQQAIIDVLPTVLAQLNVNRKARPDAKYDGWAHPLKREVFILAQPMRNAFASALPNAMARKIGLHLTANAKVDEAGTRAIAAALIKHGVLFDEVNDTQRAVSGLFSMKSGNVEFKNVWVLDRYKVAGMIPDVVKTWEKCGYQLNLGEPEQIQLIPKPTGSASALQPQT